MPTTKIRVLPALSVLLLAVFTPPARAQTCDHDSSAVADTLEASGYFPLQIGNVWDYFQESGGFWDAILREEVVADTVIHDTALYVVRQIGYQAYTNGPITDADTSYRVTGVVDGQIVTFRAGEITKRGIPLSASFSSCHELHGTSMSISGGYDAVWSFREGGERVEYELPAVKSFECCFGSWTYGYGMGMLQSIGDPFVVRDLIYARIDGREFGTQIESRFRMSIAVEETPYTRDAVQLEVYPNPASERISVAIRLADQARVTIEIVDVLGRELAVPIEDRLMAAGKHDLSWHPEEPAAGAYVIRLKINGRTAVSRTVVAIE